MGASGQCTASQDSGQDKMKRYEKFVDEIAELIRTGVLAPGQKVPSVRHASRTYGVSASTVFQAYYLLESRGLIMARARSGYFVASTCSGRCRNRRSARARPTPPRSTSASWCSPYSVRSRTRTPRALRLGVPQPATVSLPRLARIDGPRGARHGPAVGGRRHDAGQPWPAPADRPALHGRRPAAAGGRTGHQQRRAGGTQPLPAGGHPSRRPGGHRGAGVLRHLQVLERLKLKAVEIPVHPREGIDLERARRQPGAPADQGLLVHEQLPEPDGREHGRREETRPRRVAGAPPGADDRG
ncbi:GntR family transcriptional regulator [Pseudomonas aeruginosa]